MKLKNSIKDLDNYCRLHNRSISIDRNGNLNGFLSDDYNVKR